MLSNEDNKRKSLYLTDRWFPINPRALKHPEFIRMSDDLNNHRFRYYVLVGGRRTFKTERILKRGSIIEALRNKGWYLLLGAPTRKQAKDIFWEDLKGLVKDWYIDDIYDSELKIKFKNKSTIEIIGLKEFERQEGKRCNYCGITEFQQCDARVYYQAIQPMLNDTRGIGIFDGRPFGKNHFYDFYLKGVEGVEGWVSYHINAEDVLSEEQINEAKRDLALLDYNREYRASFETGGVTPYHSYTNRNHKRHSLNSNKPILVMCDFNATVKPMSWVIGQRVVEEGRHVTYLVKTFSYQHTNTSKMTDIVWEYLSDYFNVNQTTFLPKGQNKKLEVHFYGDYAGDNETSNSSLTDWDVIEGKLRNKVEYKRFIKPCRSIRLTIGSTNAQLCNALGEIRMYVDPKECRPLINDWNKSSWADNGHELNDSDPLIGHCCRAVDYFTDYVTPITHADTSEGKYR